VRQLVGNALLEPGATSAGLGLRYLAAADEFGSSLERLLGYELRAHLRDRLRSEFVTEEELAAGELADTTEIAVAFADLVDYTRLGERLPPVELGDIANQLAEMATNASHRPVQMVKTVGDAAMFVSRDDDALADTLIELVDSIDAKGPRFPQVRVGVAWGSATNRAGDWFGPPVNVASRVTELAKPGRILATEGFAERARGHEWKRRRRRALHGVANRVRLYELLRAQQNDNDDKADTDDKDAGS
jgi:adenylate cyclase